MIIGISGKIGSGKDTVGNIIRYLVQQKRINEPHSMDNYDLWNKQNDIQYENDFEIKKFADELKNTVCRWLDCTREQLEDREFKEKELGPEWRRDVYIQADGIKMKPDTDHIHNIRSLTPREMMQLLGTEAGRNIIHPNIWVITLFNKYKCIDATNRVSMGTAIDYSECKFPKWLITDTRFRNEAYAIKDRSGIIIRVNRPVIGKKYKLTHRLNTTNVTYTATAEEDFRGYDYAIFRGQDNVIFRSEDWKYMLIDDTQHASETGLDDYTFNYEIDNNFPMNDLIKNVETILIEKQII